LKSTGESLFLIQPNQTRVVDAVDYPASKTAFPMGAIRTVQQGLRRRLPLPEWGQCGISAGKRGYQRDYVSSISEMTPTNTSNSSIAGLRM
jgi:hypothetical protein